MHLIEEIGVFILVNGMKIYIQVIHFMFNLEELLEYFMNNHAWLRMALEDLKELFNHMKSLFIINL